MTRILRSACVALACAAFGTAGAAGTDELWEVSTQMNMAGMPPGMGAQTSRVCSEKGDPKKAMTRGNDKCRITDFKQSGNSVHMAMSCPEGDAVMDTTYNAAHTEYKGTMKMTSRQGDMTMTMSGRKVGSCDARQAKAEQQEKVAAYQRQADQAKATMAANDDAQIKQCARAPQTMKLEDLGMYGQCERMGGACDTYLTSEATRRVATACTASRAEFCKRYETMDGFLRADGSEQAAQACKLSREQLIAKHCPQAAQSENLAYLGRFCPAQAKTVAQAHCAGRGFTSQIRDKYTDFCRGYLSRASVAEEERQGEAQPAPAKTDPKAAVQEGVTQGINKLRGLFGR